MAKRKTEPIDMELLARIDERQESMAKDIARILEQTTKTNGRVTEIETKRLPALEHWRSKMKGVWFAIIIGAMVISSIAGFLFKYLEP